MQHACPPPPSTRAKPRAIAGGVLALMLALGLVLLAGCGADDGDEPGSDMVGLMLDAQLGETSGLAASRRHPDVLWMHDDGGNPERLFAVSTRGQRLATYRIEGVTKTDWEDIAAFEHRGKSYLMLADTGDNGGLRRTLQLHVVEEPATLQNARLKPAWSIAFRWPDGARDCEAIAVDPRRGWILLISKKRVPPELFALPLRPSGSKLLTARRIGLLAGVPQPDAAALKRSPRRAKLDGQVTAADISPDGRSLAVMTYRYLLLYRRTGNQPWGSAVAQAPHVEALPWLPQAEALGWSSDGTYLYASGEFIPAPLYRIAPLVGRASVPPPKPVD